MTRGRKPKPTALKLVTGNPGGRKLNKNEPKPASVIPDPQASLVGVALEEWKRVTVELSAIGMLSKIDGPALAAYCHAYERWVKAEGMIRELGEVIETTQGNLIQSPWVGIANKAMLIMHRFMSEFGMTPSSRSRLSVDKGVGDNRFARIPGN
jgi:P27 family predicted phage terminase small subunit